jgi:hypothetical protein
VVSVSSSALNTVWKSCCSNPFCSKMPFSLNKFFIHLQFPWPARISLDSILLTILGSNYKYFKPLIMQFLSVICYFFTLREMFSHGFVLPLSRNSNFKST